MDLRELKALEVAAHAKIAFDNGVWLVPSQTASGKYRVSLGSPPCCECEDFQLRKEPCKHILAARIVCAREYNGQAPALLADAVPKKPTYKQKWPLYNRAQQTEARRFQVLLAELCRDVADPPGAKSGRKRTAMADMVFAATLKVFTGFSSRRFACELKNAYEQGRLGHLMNSMSVNHYLDYDQMTPALEGLIVRSSLPLKAVETAFAPDSSGFSTSRFVRWFDEKYGERSGRDWVKAHAICGVKTNIVTAVQIAGRDAGDSPMLKPLVEKTAENFTVKEVPADKAYLSHDNLALVEKLGGTAYVPFKSNSLPGEAGSLWEKMFFFYQFRREEFLKHYHQRSNAESTFSMVKAKFRDHVRSKNDRAMKNEVLCKFLCHNIVVVHRSHIELGIDPVFWAEEEPAPPAAPAILPLASPG